MADKIALDLVINSAGSAKTVGEIKQSIKDIKNEMLKVGENSSEFKKLANAAAQAKDKLEDTQDAIAALDPGKLGSAFSTLGSKIAGGFQAAQGAMALFGSTGEDVQKAMLKVQAATAFAQGIQSVQDLSKAFKAFWLVLRANPVALVLTSVTALVGAMAALKDKVEIFGKAFDFVGGIVNKGVQAFKDLSDAIGLSSFKLDELSEKTKKAGEETLRRQEFVINQKKAQYDREIALAQAAGKSTIDLEIAKQKAIIETGHIQAKAAQDAGKSTNEYIQTILDAQNQIKILQLKQQQEINKQSLLNNVEFKIEADAQRDEMQAAELSDLVAHQEEKNRIKNESEDLSLQVGVQRGLAELEIEKQINAEKIAEAQKVADAKLSIEQSLFSGLSSLSQILINDQDKLQKFQKGIALAQIGADTARALSSALANANSPTPDNIATGGLAGIAKYATLAATIFANIARAKQLLSSGGGGSVDQPRFGMGGGAGVSSPSVPQLNAVSNTSTQVNQQQVESGQGALKVFVTETDITNTQNNINQITNQATIE